MKNVLILAVGALLLISFVQRDVSAQSKAGPPIAMSAGEAPAKASLSGLSVRILQRRKLGLTVVNVCRVLRDMKAVGELEQFKQDGEGVASVNVSSLAVAVADRLATENPEGWQDIDWDEVIAFLEKLLELLIKFLPLILPLFI